MNAIPRFARAQMAEKSLETRVAILESDVAHIKEDIKDIKLDVRSIQGELKAANDGIAFLQKEVAVLGTAVKQLATKEEVGAIAATIPHLATKAELQAMETNIIRWFVGTAVAIAALVFGIARFVALPGTAPATAAVPASVSSGVPGVSLPAEGLAVNERLPFHIRPSSTTNQDAHLKKQ